MMRSSLAVLVAIVPLAAQTRLADFEKLALNHPAIGQAEAGVRAAAGRALQAGLYPNPVLGANGEHNTPTLNGGSIGGFAEQRVVLGGKLGLARKAAEQDRAAQGEYAQATRLRVLTEVRTLFYRALGEQRLLDVRREMATLAGRTAQTMKELGNVGQADQPDLLAAEIESQRAQLAVTMAQNSLDRTWRELSSAVNQPSLRPVPLEGDLEALPPVNADAALTRVLAENPDLRAAEAHVSRLGFVVKRARVEKIPDLQLRGGIRYNNEPIDKLTGVPRPVGNEGIFDVGVEIPVFNRNQGSVAAAEADAERARLEIDRQRLDLRRQFAAVFREYSDATAAAARYREEMIPKARQAFDMYTSSFRQMSVAYPQVLATQRNLIQLQDDYVNQLVTAWRAASEIEGLLTVR